jgi:erythromycin esterase
MANRFVSLAEPEVMEPPPSDAFADAAVTLSGTGPAEVADGLAAADPAFADARVVGLGESTHGTSEFFTAKHGLLRYLVAECGLRTVGIEADFAAGFALDEFVTTGFGIPERALESVHDVWQTAEMVDLLRWLRDFNADGPADDQVRVFGYDAQAAAGSARAVRGVLQRFDPDLLAAVRDSLDVVTDGLPVPDAEADEARTREAIEAADEFTERVRQQFPEDGDACAERVSPRNLALARRHLDVVDAARRQREAALDGERERIAAVRERAMADGVEWVLDHQGGDRIAVWAHNEHVGTGHRTERPGVASLGQHLRERFGADYYALGLEFGTGEWTAASGETGGPAVESFGDESPPAGSPAAALSAVDAPALLVDFEPVRGEECVDEWLDTPRPVHNVPGIMSLVDDPYAEIRLGESFDGLLYVDEATASESLLGRQ